ncbi:hypothetical protein CCM_07531 [Cordyceps militaris CM01]|uniref:Uncharacterized protein n=1 Tax=Cordyceps militaris (strain CM01) TaxID=983644 RepID=G3JQ28_CORMM|nr:uncharacterized protein CCM_07531 [Cordyceps militaris CM01]EGX89279.1 hypothetical protein CCM_07531 [Cordyceps militaris CM01]
MQPVSHGATPSVVQPPPAFAQVPRYLRADYLLLPVGNRRVGIMLCPSNDTNIAMQTLLLQPLNLSRSTNVDPTK